MKRIAITVLLLAVVTLAGCSTMGKVDSQKIADAEGVLRDIKSVAQIGVDKVKIGKLNYRPSSINWKQFGHEAEALCKRLGLDYTIKDSLRAEMEK